MKIFRTAQLTPDEQQILTRLKRNPELSSALQNPRIRDVVFEVIMTLGDLPMSTIKGYIEKLKTGQLEQVEDAEVPVQPMPYSGAPQPNQ